MNEKTARGSSAVTAMVIVVGFALTSWVWTLLVLPQVALTARFGTAALGQVMLLSASLAMTMVGRLAAGILTDRCGARVMLPAVSVAAAVPLAVVGTVESIPAQPLLVCAAGVTGTMFPVGIAAVARAYPVRRRGLAVATCGAASLGGLVVGALTGPALLDGRRLVLVLAVTLLVGFAILAPTLLRDRSQGIVEPALRRTFTRTLGIPSTCRLVLLYAVPFGIMLAIMLYLPAYLNVEYGLARTPREGLTVGCLAVAAVARPIGGWLADRNAGGPTLVTCFAVAGACALAQAFPPPLPWGVLTLGGAALCLGMASGTVLALIGSLAPTGRVGAVAGVVSSVGIAAALGLPALMFATYVLDGSFGIALAVVAALLVATAAGVRRWRSLFGMRTESAAVVTAAGTLVDEFDPIEFLHRVTSWCVDLPEIDAAGLLVVDHHGHLRAVASSAEENALTRLLEIQDAQSPAQECLRTNAAVHHADLAAAARWPHFAPLAVQAGFGSMQVLPMRLRGQTIGVLILLSRQLGALNHTEDTVQALVDLAAVSLVHEHAVRDPKLLLTQRQALLHGRAVIEQAKGVLAARLGVDMDTAFTLLRGHGRPLVDMARYAINGRPPQ
ncbi:MFS transporter [Kutzneria buriramensis]|uniref:MFS transporter n=1 Tax=Kutzneria buriramensis TaxID=1045776 RepID=UPI001476E278|nr:MFS transporter [Kutzneria buriramensis]